LAPKEDGGYARIWIGVSASIDFIALPAANDVCKLTSTAAPLTGGYYCTNPDGTDFPNRTSPTENATLTKGNSGNAPGGLAGRDVRVMLSFDYAINANFLAGARLGYVFNAYTGDAASKDGHAFAPLHLELRATYLFGTDPLAHLGFAPYASAGAGATEIDARSIVQVTQTGIAGQSPKIAWITGGPLFFSLGAGARYAFSPRVAFQAGARFIGAFGGGGGFLPAYAPEVALAYGF
jgi:opacity protein-like surface antigen